MTNPQIADIFDEMADLLEFKGENAFRVRAYRNGARAIRNLTQSAASMVADNWKQLLEIDGVGKAVAEKTVTLVETGELPQLKDLLDEIPGTVLAMLRIPGLGPKKAAVLYRELGIENLEQLAAACQSGQVRELKGFGAKTEQAILDGMAIAEAANERIYWADADQIAAAVREHLSKTTEVKRLELAGSYRRGRETVGDLDVLVVAENPEHVMDRFAEFPGVANVIGRGDTKLSLRLDSGFQMDLRIVPEESFGAALQYFTGSKEHNVELRGRAKQRGLKINEYGVYRIDGDQQVYVAGAEEKDVYATLDLPWFPPELRENRQEFHWASGEGLPKLVELKDIRGDLHMHTHATDGKASMREMAEAAQQRGLTYVAITDHSQRVSMARGLDSKRLLAQWSEVDDLNDEYGEAFTLLKGIECDILEKGGMDLPDDVLAEADWVLASIHYGQKQSRQQITDRILGAIENPHVSAVAHPTGRLLNRREPYEVDIGLVLESAKQHGKMLELNANPMRLDLNDVFCAAAKRHGIPIVINTDAHSTEGLNVMRYGILQARRAGLTASDIANTRDWPQIKEMMKAQS